MVKVIIWLDSFKIGAEGVDAVILGLIAEQLVSQVKIFQRGVEERLWADEGAPHELQGQYIALVCSGQENIHLGEVDVVGNKATKRPTPPGVVEVVVQGEHGVIIEQIVAFLGCADTIISKDAGDRVGNLLYAHQALFQLVPVPSLTECFRF